MPVTPHFSVENNDSMNEFESMPIFHVFTKLCGDKVFMVNNSLNPITTRLRNGLSRTLMACGGPVRNINKKTKMAHLFWKINCSTKNFSPYCIQKLKYKDFYRFITQNSDLLNRYGDMMDQPSDHDEETEVCVFNFPCL